MEFLIENWQEFLIWNVTAISVVFLGCGILDNAARRLVQTNAPWLLLAALILGSGGAFLEVITPQRLAHIVRSAPLTAAASRAA